MSVVNHFVVDGRRRQIHHGVQTARLAFLPLRAVQLNLVTLRQPPRGAVRSVVGVDENSAVGVRLAARHHLEFEVLEPLEALRALAHEEEVRALPGGAGAEGAVDDGPGIRIHVGFPAGEIAAVEEHAPPIGGLRRKNERRGQCREHKVS